MRTGAVGAVVLSSVCVGLSARADALIRNYDVSNVVVEAGQAMTLTGPIHAEWAAAGFEKTGGGTLTMSPNVTDAGNAIDLCVREGRVILNDAEAASVTEEEPTALMNRATLWLDAAKNVVPNETQTGVATWHDVRETTDEDGTLSITRHYAYAGATRKVSGSDPVAAVPPVLSNDVAGAGLPMMYFNGPKTGSWMGFRNKSGGSDDFETIRHVFAVIKVEKSYGFVLGSWGNVFVHPANTSGALGDRYISYCAAHPTLAQSTFYLNGERINPFSETVRTGVQLIEIQCPRDCTGSAIAYFFNDRNIASRYGGDFIGEVLIYNGTKDLNPDERFQVGRWLMQKWGITPAKGALNVKTAVGSELEVGATASGTVSYSGRGTLVKTGSGTNELIPAAGQDSTAYRIRVDGGTLKAQAGEIDYDFRPGTKLSTALDTYETVTLAAETDADAQARGEVTQTGAARLRIGDLGDDVKLLTVGAGELTLGTTALAAETVKTGGVVYATFPDPSFEQCGVQNSWSSTANFTWGGWTLSPREPTNGAVAILNPKKEIVPGGGSTWWYGFNSSSAFDTYEPARFWATDGDKVMLIKGQGYATTTVSVPADGDYVLSFDATGRIGYANAYPALSLVDANGTTNTFAKFHIPDGTGFRPYRFLIRNVKAGSYTFLIDNMANQSGDRHAIFDNFKMRCLSDTADSGVVPVPNGNFEVAEFQQTSGVRKSATATGWTLTQGSVGAAATVPEDYDVVLTTRRESKFYPDAVSAYGETILHFRGADGRATSAPFHLPAGRWRLRCTAMRWGFTDQASEFWNNLGSVLNPSVGAKVSVNGGERFDSVSTAIDLRQWDAVSMTLPDVLEVEDGDSVVVELRQATATTSTSAAYLFVDDVEFVPVVGDLGELVSNGNFMGSTTGWTLVSHKEGSSNADPLWYSSARLQGCDKNYGYTLCNGANGLLFVQIGEASQTLNLAESGVYRLSFWTRARYYVDAASGKTSVYYGGNKIRATLAAEGSSETNEILVTESICSTNYLRQVALFKIPESATGRYVLKLQGLNNGTDVITQPPGMSTRDANAYVASVSVKKVADASAPQLSEDLEIVDGNPDAKLRLDYDGRINLKRVKLGRRSLIGVISAKTHPELVSGLGEAYVEPRGAYILIR